MIQLFKALLDKPELYQQIVPHFFLVGLAIYALWKGMRHAASYLDVEVDAGGSWFFGDSAFAAGATQGVELPAPGIRATQQSPRAQRPPRSLDRSRASRGGIDRGRGRGMWRLRFLCGLRGKGQLSDHHP